MKAVRFACSTAPALGGIIPRVCSKKALTVNTRRKAQDVPKEFYKVEAVVRPWRSLERQTGSEFTEDSFVSKVKRDACHGKLQEAMQVFTKVTMADSYMWASIILAHARHGQATQAIRLYKQMRAASIKPSNYVVGSVLKACIAACDLASGRQIHCDIFGTGGKPNIFVGNCLVNMYVKCGSLEEARAVFENLSTRDVVTWNTMISGYAQHGLGPEALALYADMQQDSSSKANTITFVCLLQACAKIGALHQGKQLHAQILQRGLEADPVIGSCLVDMYAKCRSLEHAREVFDRLPSRDVVAWTAMIGAYVQQGLGREALALYAKMQEDNTTPIDTATFTCLLQACASVGAVRLGKQLEAQIWQRGLQADVVVGSSLIDMYVKCGTLADARRVFDSLSSRDVVTWNALLSGYAHHSDSQMALQCFKDMREQGVEPDAVTFTCLLVACSHAELVNNGEQLFKMMLDSYKIAPTVNHYNCMVDLLARSGRLNDAEDMLQTMPFQDDVVGWRSLLSACKTNGDVERGKRCFDRLVMLDPANASAYVLLTSIYANAGMWADVDKIERLRKSAGAKKKAAKACIEVKNEVHEFTVGEERADILPKLKSVNLMLKKGGHVPQTQLVLKAISEQEKEDALCGHAEKLALAYGLLNTPDGTTLLVTKNLRMCNDCHSGTKIMSRLEKREIIVRDAHRVHRFVDGSCLCGDRH